MIETQRLKLRPLKHSDSDAFNVLFSDTEVMRSSIYGTKTQEEVKEWLANQIDSKHHSTGIELLAVTCKSTQVIIGYCGLAQFRNIGEADAKILEIGYRLIRKYWGYGYATEAATAVRDYAFNELSITRLVALIEPINERSIGVAKRIGMSYEKDIMLDGYDHPDHLYTMSNNAYK